MRRTVASVGVLLAMGVTLLIWWLGCCLNKGTQEPPPNIDEEPMTARQDNRAGQELFPPGIYLVHARVISVQRLDRRVEHSQLQIERIYVGELSVKGRTFEAVQYQTDLGQCFSVSLKEPDTQNPPMEVGEVVYGG